MHFDPSLPRGQVIAKLRRHARHNAARLFAKPWSTSDTARDQILTHAQVLRLMKTSYWDDAT